MKKSKIKKIRDKNGKSVLLLEVKGESFDLLSCKDAAEHWEKAGFETCPFCGVAPDNDGVVIHDRFGLLH